MSLKKIAEALVKKHRYRGWEVRLKEDDKTITITDGKDTHEFHGKSVTIEYHQQEALQAASNWIQNYETTIQEDEIKDFTMLCVMIKQAQDQALMIENKFTKMDKGRLNKFLNGCKAMVKSLEMRMDNGPAEFENGTYAILEYMRDVNKTAVQALLDGKGDDFQTLVNIYKSGKYEFKSQKESS